MRGFIHAYIHTYMHTYIHTYMHACMHTHTHILVHLYISAHAEPTVLLLSAIHPYPTMVSGFEASASEG